MLAVPQNESRQETSEDLRQLISDMDQRWAEEKERLVTSIRNLQLQVTKLKAEVAKH